MYIFQVTKLSRVSLGSLSADTTAEYDEAILNDGLREGGCRLIGEREGREKEEGEDRWSREEEEVGTTRGTREDERETTSERREREGISARMDEC